MLDIEDADAVLDGRQHVRRPCRCAIAPLNGVFDRSVGRGEALDGAWNTWHMGADTH